MSNISIGTTMRRYTFQIIVTVGQLLGCFASFVISPQFLSFTAQNTLISQNQPAIASSVESVLHPPSAAVDGDTKTRWASTMGSDQQWIAIDFGKVVSM